jgi:DNA-binding transcriptional regulator YdaS (Cro superfamily)
VRTSDAQVRTLMQEMAKHGHVGRAAVKADMDRKTARKYVAASGATRERAGRDGEAVGEPRK